MGIINKRMSAGLLAFAVVSGLTGCIPAPYEQNIPATTYTVDENGNKVKVQHNASDKKTEAEIVAETADTFYSSIFSGELMKQLEEIRTQTLDHYKEKGIAEKDIPEDEATDYMYDLIMKSDIAFVDLVHVADDVDKDDFMTVLGLVAFGSMAGGGEVKLRIEPQDIVIKGGDKATLNMSQAEMQLSKDGEWKSMDDGSGDEDMLVYFKKVDGKWYFDLDANVNSEGSGVSAG